MKVSERFLLIIIKMEMEWVDGSSWHEDVDEIIPKLYVSSVFVSESLEKLQKLGVTHIIVAGKGLEVAHPTSFSYK